MALFFVFQLALLRDRSDWESRHEVHVIKNAVKSSSVLHVTCTLFCSTGVLLSTSSSTSRIVLVVLLLVVLVVLLLATSSSSSL